jgi:hypothetical protein
VLVESSAEDLVDHALAGDRGRVIDGSARLLTAAEGAARAALAAATPAEQVTALRRRARHVAALADRGSFIDVALAANEVSELMPGLYGRFAVPAPVALLRLDYLDREIQLLALARKPDRVPGLVGALERTWVGLRARVVARNGASEAAAFSRHVASMRRLARAGGPRLQHEAGNGLNLVDDLEGLF